MSEQCTERRLGLPQAEIELQDPAAARPSPVDDGDDVLLKPSSSGARDRRGAPLFDDDDDDASHRPGATNDPPESRGALARLAAALAAEPLLAKTLAGVVVGIVLGAIVRATDPTPRAIELVGFPGELFMRLLRALVLPLIVVSMVCGVCSLAKGSEGSARRVATRLLAAYAITSLVACALGLLVVSVARPGDGVSFDANGCAGAGATNGTVAGAATSDDDHAADAHRGALDAILGTARAAVTPNVVAAAADGNILGVIVASLAFGASLAAVGEDVARPIVDVFFSMNVVVQTMIAWALTLMPVGVLSLVAGRVAATCDAGAVLVALGKYVATVTFALAAHGGGVLPGLYALATRGMGVTRGGGEKRRWASLDGGEGGGGGVTGDGGGGEVHGAVEVLRRSAPALGCAFAIDSSSATLPVTLRCAKTLGIPTDLAEFALPLGATINMNGTALYEALTVIFIAQLHGVKLGIGTTIVIALTSTIAAVGAAAIPSAGLVTMLIVLQAAGLEEFSGDIGILMSVDWFLDRLRTVVNVEGDLFVASAVAAWEGKEGGGGGDDGGDDDDIFDETTIRNEA